MKKENLFEFEYDDEDGADLFPNAEDEEDLEDEMMDAFERFLKN